MSKSIKSNIEANPIPPIPSPPPSVLSSSPLSLQLLLPLLALSVLRHRCNCRHCRCYNFASPVNVVPHFVGGVGGNGTPPPCCTSQGLLLRVSFAVFASLPHHQKQPAMFQNLSLLCRKLLHLEHLVDGCEFYTCCLWLSPAIKRVEVQSNGW